MATATMLRWRLRVLMAEVNINATELSMLSGVSRTTISKLKNSDEITQISSDVFNKLLSALTIAYKEKYAMTNDKRFDRSITSNDLWEFSLDDNT